MYYAYIYIYIINHILFIVVRNYHRSPYISFGVIFKITCFSFFHVFILYISEPNGVISLCMRAIEIGRVGLGVERFNP